MQIRWTESAVKDLENIKDYILKDSEYYATDFIGKIFESVEKLPFFPQIGRIVPEFNDGSIREIIFYNYRIIYKINLDQLMILGIIHASRDINNIKPNPWEII
jgi:toxin ParE1/3/4